MERLVYKLGFRKRLRIAQGPRTTTEYASAAKISREQLSRYGNPQGPRPQRRTLERLAMAAFDGPFRPEWLETGDGPMRGERIPIVGSSTAGAGLADERPGDEDLIAQRIEQLETMGGVDHEMTRELLLLTARRVRELGREVAEIVRTIRERGPASGPGESEENVNAAGR